MDILHWMHNSSSMTVAEFAAVLRKMPSRKRVCFSGCPFGLSFYRVKNRGSLMQIEFNQSVDRDSSGRLTVTEYSGAEVDPNRAITVAELIQGFDCPEYSQLPLIFGGDEDALQFHGVRDRGEWVSVDFFQHIYRGRTGVLIVEDVVGGRVVVEGFGSLMEGDEE